MDPRIVVLGGGAWGSALAIHLATRSHLRPRVALYLRSAGQAAACAAARENARYLPGVAFPPALTVTADLAAARDADLLIAAVPAAEVLPLAVTLRAAGANAPVALAAKGFVVDGSTRGGYALPQAVLARDWPAPVGVISGPSFALEVAQGLPTALVAGAADRAWGRGLAALVRGAAMRCYESDDVTGIGVGGAVKNVLAIAAGTSDGLGFGDNARAALVTRGLAECGRLSGALGGRRETMMGLAGLGDLVLTCTGNLSRNRRVGLALARGEPLGDILAGLGHVAEGVAATRAVHALALAYGLDLPISEAVHSVLYGGVPARDAVRTLLAREPGGEDA
ncbi:MAG: NAD(P)-dependent glycerol-3-phosphate dehydrogenase [Proteobacteria bacterium]|jgi:glycerol-3-phosphate dehydrogenase (NAD(P)+)|nr:NAD(P)-dependent glycerol-3-phosphate dehydrogenase [Pseudomonadota bacterium]